MSACCEACRVARLAFACCGLRYVVADDIAPGAGQLALHASLVLGGQLGERCAVRIEALAPLPFPRGALFARIPVAANVVGNHERLVRPVELAAGRGDLVRAERRAVRRLGALLVRRAVADDRLAADQRRPILLRRRLRDRRLDRLRVMAIDVADDLPAIRFEALRRVVGEPAVHFAVDRDAVVVVERDQLAELEGPGQRAGLVRDSFHQAAVAEEHPGAVIDHVEAGAIELGGEPLLRERHAHGIRQPLAERPGGGLDAEVRLVLGMAGGMRTQLPERLQVVDRQRVAGQVQQRVQQHRAVAVREHEAVAVGPLRIAGIVAQVVAPQDLRDVGHAHRHAWVAGVGFLDRVHREGPDRIGKLPASRCLHQEVIPFGRSGSGVERPRILDQRPRVGNARARCAGPDRASAGQSPSAPAVRRSANNPTVMRGGGCP